MNNLITPLEKTVLRLLAAKETKHQESVFDQIKHAKIGSRQVTSAGFITNFTVPESTKTLTTMSKTKVFEIYAEHPYTHAGAEFLLWFEHGRLKSLEGYVFIGQWPTEEYNFHFHTHHGSLCSDMVRENNFAPQYASNCN